MYILKLNKYQTIIGVTSTTSEHVLQKLYIGGAK